MATYPNIVSNTTTGDDAKTRINNVGASSEIAVKVITEIAEVGNEVGYFRTDSLVYSLAEKAWYKYSGTEWEQTSLYIQVGEDSSTANAANVGKIRYRTSSDNSYCEMCMQTGAATYAWVVIVENNW
jgi:hypothetical protein